MNQNTIEQDVDRGLEIHRLMTELKAELEQINGRLQLVALSGEQIPLADKKREGMQYLAQGSLAKVPVVITADAIMGEFMEDSPAHLKVKAAAQGLFPKFFKRVVAYVNVKKDNGKAFRQLADELLGKDAPAFIEACKSRDKDGIPKNAVKVEWDRAEVPTCIAA
jgi:hypothetical protein